MIQKRKHASFSLLYIAAKLYFAGNNLSHDRTHPIQRQKHNLNWTDKDFTTKDIIR